MTYANVADSLSVTFERHPTELRVIGWLPIGGFVAAQAVAFAHRGYLDARNLRPAPLERLVRFIVLLPWGVVALVLTGIGKRGTWFPQVLADFQEASPELADGLVIGRWSLLVGLILAAFGLAMAHHSAGFRGEAASRIEYTLAAGLFTCAAISLTIALLGPPP